MLVTGTDIPSEGEMITINVTGSTDITLSLDFDKIEYNPGEPKNNNNSY